MTKHDDTVADSRNCTLWLNINSSFWTFFILKIKVLFLDYWFTVWKVQDFSASQILREINFGHFEVPRTAILNFLSALSFHPYLLELQFLHSKISQNWFHVKLTKVGKSVHFHTVQIWLKLEFWQIFSGFEIDFT